MQTLKNEALAGLLSSSLTRIRIILAISTGPLVSVFKLQGSNNLSMQNVRKVPIGRDAPISKP